jgi:hypothetical protein
MKSGLCAVGRSAKGRRFSGRMAVKWGVYGCGGCE